MRRRNIRKAKKDSRTKNVSPARSTRRRRLGCWAALLVFAVIWVQQSYFPHLETDDPPIAGNSLGISKELAEVREHWVSSPKATIYQVMMIHPPNFLDPQSFKRETTKRLIHQNQAEVHQILLLLSEKLKLTELVLDSVSDEREAIFQKMIEDIREAKNKGLSDAGARHLEKVQAINAALHAAVDGKFKRIRGLESQDLCDRNLKLIEEGASYYRIKRIFADRDRHLVRQVAERGGDFLFVFGAMHRPAIAAKEWNQEHPDAQVSVIEITPVSIPYNRNQLYRLSKEWDE